MLTPYLPYPLLSGGQIRTYNLLKHLSKKHDITLFSFIRDEKEKKYIKQLKEYCSEVEVFCKRPPWSFTSLTLAAVSFYPLVVCMYLNRKIQESITNAIGRKHFDLIHAETFYVMPNIPKNNIPIILAEQTIEYLVYKHYTDKVGFAPQKILMKWDVAKINFWEKRFWHRATQIIAMSNADKKVMQKLDSDLTVDLVPNGVDTEFFSDKRINRSEVQKTVLFVGNFKWLQNREAVSILVKKVWPKIKEKLPNTRLWIVGKFPSEEILSFAGEFIRVSQDIEDIRIAYNNADILLAPIYGPGGTRYKILESMATGLPVVTTSTGIEGLDAKHGQEAMVGETPSDLAQETIHILTNKSLYKKLAKNGRNLVVSKFNWKTIAESIDLIYKKAANAKKY